MLSFGADGQTAAACSGGLVRLGQKYRGDSTGGVGATMVVSGLQNSDGERRTKGATAGVQPQGTPKRW